MGLTNRQFEEQCFGINGATYESGTTAYTSVTYCAITAVADTVFASLAMDGLDGDSTATMPLPAGATIFGRITAFTLTSGKVLAYKRSG